LILKACTGTKKREKKERTEKNEKRKTRRNEREAGQRAIRRILSKARKNTEARATTPPAQHAFIAIIFVI
jgi:hypothetical protein